jgi:excinuclease ABC subunit A
MTELTFSFSEQVVVKDSHPVGPTITKTFYILDEPSTGLHFQDIGLLIDVLQKLVDRGNTVLVIEHNLDMIKVADHIIDIGPEGGNGGGKVLYEGTPEKMVSIKESITAKYVKAELM